MKTLDEFLYEVILAAQARGANEKVVAENAARAFNAGLAAEKASRIQQAHTGSGGTTKGPSTSANCSA